MSASEVANDTLPSQKATITTEERQQREAKATDDEMMAISFFIKRDYYFSKEDFSGRTRCNISLIHCNEGNDLSSLSWVSLIQKK